VSDVCGRGYRWKGRFLASGHGEGQGLARDGQHGSEREVVRDGLLQVIGLSQSQRREGEHARYRKGHAVHPEANPGAEDRFKEISTPRRPRDSERERVRRGPPGSVHGANLGGLRWCRRQVAAGRTTPSDSEGTPRRRRMSGRTDRRHLRRGEGTSWRRGTQRGTDLEAELHMSFKTPWRGVTPRSNVMGEARATHATDGSAPANADSCHRCGGRRGARRQPGLFLLQPGHARTCGGRGVVSGSRRRAPMPRHRREYGKPPGAGEDRREWRRPAHPGQRAGWPRTTTTVRRRLYVIVAGRQRTSSSVAAGGPMTLGDPSLLRGRAGATIRGDRARRGGTMRIPPGDALGEDIPACAGGVSRAASRLGGPARKRSSGGCASPERKPSGVAGGRTWPSGLRGVPEISTWGV